MFGLQSAPGCGRYPYLPTTTAPGFTRMRVGCPRRRLAWSARKGRQMATQDTEGHDLGSADYLERALDDLNRARQGATAEVISVIDSGMGRVREALGQFQSGAEDRAEQLKARATDRTADWERVLEGTSADDRQELGIRIVRAQRSKEALKAMSKEIRRQKKELRRQGKEGQLGE